jgi:hypothetical protein
MHVEVRKQAAAVDTYASEKQKSITAKILM